jgi:cyclopropane-fatty-acyl-phospholipid synthase
MAASAVNFEDGQIQVHQTLAVRADRGASKMPARPDWGA